MRRVPIWIKKELYKYKSFMFAAVFVILLDVLVLLLLPNFLTMIIDVAIPYKDIVLLGKCAIISMILYVLTNFFTLIIDLIFARIGTEFTLSLKKQLFCDTYRMSGEKIFQTQDRLLPIFINDITIIEGFFTKGIPKLISNLLFVSTTLIVLFFYNYKLSIIVLVMIVIMCIFQMVINNRIKTEFQILLEKFDLSTSYLENYFANLTNSIGYNSLEYFKGNFYDKELKVQLQRKEVGYITSFSKFVPSTIIGFTNVMILGLGAKWVFEGTLTLGVLTIFLYYASRIFYPILSILSFSTDWKRVQNSIKRINDLKKEVTHE